MIKSGIAGSIRGHYKLEKYNANTNELKQVLEFDNKILNAGLNGLHTHSAGGYQPDALGFAVGTGTSVPLATNVGLDNLIASGGNRVGSVLLNPTAPDYVSARRYVTRFNAGVINNTITEIGSFLMYGNNKYEYLSRSLILDNNGNPTSVTVADNEYLDVTYDLYFYPKTFETTGTFELEGITYEYLNRTIEIQSVSLHNSSNGYSFADNQWFLRTYSDNTPSNFDDKVTGSYISNFSYEGDYIPNTFKRKVSFTLDLNQGNFDGGLGSIIIRSAYMVRYLSKITFNPKLPKDNTCRMKFVFESPQLAEYVPPPTPSTGD